MTGFEDKVERRSRLDTADTDWDDGLRFIFSEEHSLVHTEYADFADILWRSNTMKGEEAIKVIAWLELGEGHDPLRQMLTRILRHKRTG